MKRCFLCGKDRGLKQNLRFHRRTPYLLFGLPLPEGRVGTDWET
jgi:hypothetical protein